MDEQGIEHRLTKILSDSDSAPFLFIGSGFSRRYIDLPDWIGLLQKFSKRPFANYLGRANGNIPLAALYLAENYFDEWWEVNGDKEHIYKSKEWSDKIETPLKYEISEYLKNYDITNEMLTNAELLELRNEKVVIDGIITTNWDLLLESIFPKLKVYVGQSDILFKHPQAIGEIFKIHGCCTKYNSLVLSSTDYDGFNDKNPYLASKLISIFLEKPVIFLGYSITDRNITDILEVIETVIDSEEKIAQLAKNMIFVERANGDDEEISKIIKVINGKSLPFTNIKTDDFGKVFRALQHAERKIPVDFLRTLKNQIYNIVNSRDKTNLRLKAVDFEDVINGDDIEFVAGIGVANNPIYARKGLSGLTVMDLFKDIIFDDINFSIEDISKIVPDLMKQTPTFIPIRKYVGNSNPFLINSTSTNIANRMDRNSQDFFEKIPNRTSILKQLSSINKVEDIINLHKGDLDTTFQTLAFWLYSNKTLDNCQLVKELVKGLVKGKLEIWFGKDSLGYSMKTLVCIIDEVENNDLKP